MEKSIKRAKNFKDEECNLILELVKEKKHVIESKKTDLVTAKEKEEAWKQLAEKFNEKNMLFRDWKTIKGKYDNMKKMCKKKFSEEKTYVKGTGGGPDQPSNISVLDWEIKDLLGSQVDGNKSKYDSDVNDVNYVDVFQMCLPEDNSEIIQNSIEEEGANCNILDSFAISEEQISAPSPSVSQEKCVQQVKIRDRKSSPLRVVKKRSRSGTRQGIDQTTTGKQISDLATEKKELLELQKNIYKKQFEILEEEYKVKVKCMNEEHELKVNHMKEQHELKVKNLQLSNRNLELDMKLKERQLHM